MDSTMKRRRRTGRGLISRPVFDGVFDALFVMREDLDVLYALVIADWGFGGAKEAALTME